MTASTRLRQRQDEMAVDGSRGVTETERQGLTGAGFALAGGFLLSFILYIAYGSAFGASILWTGLGVLCLAVAAFLPLRPTKRIVAGAMLGWMAMSAVLLLGDPAWSLMTSGTPHEALPNAAKLLIAVGVVCISAGAWRDGRLLGLVRLPIVLAGLIVGATWSLQQHPAPALDVWRMHDAAADRLLHFQNPYALHVENPFHPGPIEFYGYAPVSLLAMTAAKVMGGDVRWASIAGLAFAAIAASFVGRRAGLPAWAADAAGAVVALQGRPFMLIEIGWTEPVVLGLIAAGVLVMVLRRPPSPGLLAFGLASKQFLWVFLPVLFAMKPQARKTTARALALVALVVGLFWLWDPHRFVYGVVTSHLNGDGMRLAYPDVPHGDPWPGSNTLATYLLSQWHLRWPMVIGPLAWLSVAAAFPFSKDRSVGKLVLSSTAALGLLGFLGSAFNANYIWLLPPLAVLGVLAALVDKPSEPGLPAS